MRLIDADKLKKHYSWWKGKEKEIFDNIVDLQPTVDMENGMFLEIDGVQGYFTKEFITDCVKTYLNK